MGFWALLVITNSDYCHEVHGAMYCSRQTSPDL
jgi:hypothetical protein